MNRNKYINNSILNYFWNKIRIWVSELFALDENVVHKTNSEIIDGVKTINDKLEFKNGSTSIDGTSNIQLTGIMANTDFWRISAGATANDSGFLEISTHDNGDEPIYFKQYKNSNNTVRTLTLMDNSGNSSFPGTITATGFTGNVTGNVSGTSSNVTDTVAIENGGTGATTRLNALKALTNDNIGTDAQYFLTISSGYGKGGYTSVSNAATILGTAFTTGTRMLFQQSAAPTGWTKETGTGYNNIALRLTTGDIANKTNGKAFTTCMASARASANATQGGTIANTTATGSLSKTKAGGSNANATQGGTISNTTAGGTVGNKALSVAMLASHEHNLTERYNNGTIHDSWGLEVIKTTVANTCNDKIANTGSGANHNHSFTGTAHGHTFTGAAHTHTFTGTEHTHTFTGTAHNHTFTGSAHNHTLDLDINYIDCIIASKA